MTAQEVARLHGIGGKELVVERHDNRVSLYVDEPDAAVIVVDTETFAEFAREIGGVS